MHIFLKELTRTGKAYWFAVAFMAFASMAIIDSFTGVFGGKLATVLMILSALSLISYLVFLFIQEKNKKMVEAQLNKLEAERKLAVRKTVQENPDFQTFCHECLHFDQEILGCRLHLVERHSLIKMQPEDQRQYCLYYNFSFPFYLQQALYPAKWKRSGRDMI